MYRGEVVHIRHTPVEHRFAYPLSFFGFDLAELDQLDRQQSLFGHNRRATLTLKDSDYLDGKDQPIREQLAHYLNNIPNAAEVRLITSPRYLGYAFNPVNFYLVLHEGRLHCALAEVNNTFGDRHVYPLPDLEQVDANTWEAHLGKSFHVSPFNDLEGYYHFIFKLEADSLCLTVNLYREDKRHMSTWLSGKAQTLSSGNIWKHALLKPFDTTLNTMPRILWQAAMLYYRKKMAYVPRPIPSDPHTIKARQMQGR